MKSPLRFVTLAILLLPSLLSSATLTFENLNDSDVVTTQFSGLVFSNAQILTSGVSLNEFEFPPHSGVNVVSDSFGPLSITFANTQSALSGYFTYSSRLTLQFYDSASNLIGAVSSSHSINAALSGEPGSSPNEFLQFSSALGISKVIIAGDPAGGSFVLDDLTYSSTAPEPPASAALLAGLSLLIAGHYLRRFRNRKSDIVLFIFSAPLLHSQTLSSPTVVPNSIPIGTLTLVTVTVPIADASLIGTSVNLQRLDNTTKTWRVLSALYDDGSHGDSKPADGVFGLAYAFNESSQTPVTLRISAAFKGRLARVFSSPFNLDVTATGGQPTFEITLIGIGSGSVVSADGKINCPGTCVASYEVGSQVTLTAKPTGSSSFAGWSGAGCSSAQICSFLVSKAAAATAKFNWAGTSPSYRLSVGKAGPGDGDVTSSDGIINCGARCSAQYNSKAAVTLVANPKAHFTFDGWSGACAGLGACAVTLDSAKFVQATFNTDSAEVFRAFASAKPGTGYFPLRVDFTASAIDPKGNAIAFRAWDWDGDGVYDSCNPSAPSSCDNDATPKTHVYQTPGRYTARVLFQNVLGERATATIAIQVRAKNAEAKIGEAESAGTIDAATALTYRVFAAFGDPRLPAAYVGDDGTEESDLVTNELTKNFGILNDTQKALMAPFLIPPAYPGSWYSLRKAGAAAAVLNQKASGTAVAPAAVTNRPFCPFAFEKGWTFEDGDKVRVHFDFDRYPDHRQLALWLIQEMKGTIWPKLTGLMDGDQHLISDNDLASGCNGGNGLVDFYIIDVAKFPGQATQDIDCVPSPGFALLTARALRSAHRGGIAAHEFMHILQFGYKEKNSCGLPEWWADATAAWAQDFVYDDPKGNPGGEQDFADYFLFSTQLPLEDDPKGSKRRYGAYVFPFDLSHREGSYVVPASWEQLANFADPLDAIDNIFAATPLFETSWPTFSFDNLNYYSQDQYDKWDSLPSFGRIQDEIAVTPAKGKTDFSYEFKDELKHLSSVAYHLSFFDNNIRSVSFYNGLGFKLSSPNQAPVGRYVSYEELTEEQKKGVSVQAVFKTNGKWTAVQDLTNYPETGFCRDIAGQRIEEMVLVFSNWDKDATRTIKPEGDPSLLFASNAACYQWTGKLSVDDNSSGVREITTWTNLTFTAATGPSVNATANATGIPSGVPLPLPFQIFYKATGGTVDWSISGNTGSCVVSGSASGKPLGEFPYTYLTTFNGVLSGNQYRGLLMPLGWRSGAEPKVTVNQSGKDCNSYTKPLNGFVLDTLVDAAKLSDSGDRIHGSRVVPSASGATTIQWDFVARQQP